MTQNRPVHRERLAMSRPHNLQDPQSFATQPTLSGGKALRRQNDDSIAT